MGPDATSRTNGMVEINKRLAKMGERHLGGTSNYNK